MTQEQSALYMEATLPPELYHNFALLQRADRLTFEGKTEVLSYFVDKMKSDVMTHLVDNGTAIEGMSEEHRQDFYSMLDELVNSCSNALFTLHQREADREQGKLVKDSPMFQEAIQKVQLLSDNMNLIDSQRL